MYKKLSLLLILFGLLVPDSAYSFGQKLTWGEIEDCKNKARKEINEFSARQTFEDCKKYKKKAKKDSIKYLKDLKKKQDNWCKKNKGTYRTNLVKYENLTKQRRSTTDYKKIWEFIDKSFGKKPLPGKRRYVSRSLFDYPPEAFKDFPDLKAELAFWRSNIVPFDKCNYPFMRVYDNKAMTPKEYEKFINQPKRKK